MAPREPALRALLDARRVTDQLDAPAGLMASKSAVISTAVDVGASALWPTLSVLVPPCFPLTDQLVQLSTTGLLVTVAAPPVAVRLVRDGIEK